MDKLLHIFFTINDLATRQAIRLEGESNHILPEEEGFDKHAYYVGWTPVKCSVTLYPGIHRSLINESWDFYLKVHDSKSGGGLLLFEEKPTVGDQKKGVKELVITKRPHEQAATFYLAGEFGKPGYEDINLENLNDFLNSENANGQIGTYITAEFRGLRRSQPSAAVPIMVRVRKNANSLTKDERKRFLKAFAKISNSGTTRGKYGPKGPNGRELVKKPTSILDELVLMHTYDARDEIHRRSVFHPWHRLFLLHLERELQAVDPSVTIPFWKFDEIAPKLFTPDFIGVPTNSGTRASQVTFKGGKEREKDHPLYSYVKTTFWGPLTRGYGRNVDPTIATYYMIKAEAKVINQGGNFGFWGKAAERNPHNYAHDMFSGRVSDIGQDPVDPLFFMIHANVDRIWALWQHRDFSRYRYNKVEAYEPQGKTTGSSRSGVGNRVEDGLWPWYPDYVPPRPNRRSDRNQGDVERRGRDFPQIKITVPGPQGNYRKYSEPLVKDTIDYQGIVGEMPAGFEYADVPFFKHQDSTSRASLLSHFSGEESAAQRFFSDGMTSEDRKSILGNLSEIPDGFVTEARQLIENVKEDVTVRSGLMWMIENQDEAFLKSLLRIASFVEEKVDFRLAVIHRLRTSKRSSVSFPAFQSEFLGGLKKLMENVEEHPDIRLEAIDILATYEDERLETLLIKTIEDEANIPVSKIEAISLLRSYSKSDTITKVFKAVVTNEEDIALKAEALLGMSHSPNEEEYLGQIISDQSNSGLLREAASLALHSFNPEKIHQFAIEHFNTISKAPEALTRSASNENGDAEFNATLMNLLLYTADHDTLKQDETLSDALAGLAPEALENVGFRVQASEDTSESHMAFLEMANELTKLLEGDVE